jgi:regulator of RNase E activity RraA
MAGRAFTVGTELVDAPPEVPYIGLLAALDALGAGEVWVVSGHGRADVALWGELLTRTAQAAGAAGALCDGAVRDVAPVVELDYPVFARGRCATDMNGRIEVTGTGGTVEIDGIEIAHGDLVVADDDGVVVVPASSADEVVRRALEKHSAERRFADDLAQGTAATEAFRRHGVL